ncbi:unnamed protein product [Euphydryas editha]|uniref:Uncharacterized protein n=1 Tax=Euphydryas editha TaxID=104508 RepID=A0AAU9TXM0_EUPED|nr:unnamed protein product [Euphydryas editha]
MQAMSANASAPRAPQRSPFAIQELLGLSDSRDSRDRYFENRDGDRVLNLSENREPRSAYTPQFPLPASMASRVAYAAAFNAQAAVAAAFLPGPPLLHPPPGTWIAKSFSKFVLENNLHAQYSSFNGFSEVIS